jgi:translation initiation factor IF-2
LIAEVEDYKAPKTKFAFGTVIESHIDIGRGAVATILIEGGELHTKEAIVIGST